MPSAEITYIDNMNLMDILVASKITTSKSEARRLIVGNGISVNNTKEINPERIFTKDEIKDLIISKGKKTHIKVNLVK